MEGHERFLTQGLQDLKTSHGTRHFLPLPAVFSKNLNTLVFDQQIARNLLIPVLVVICLVKR